MPITSMYVIHVPKVHLVLQAQTVSVCMLWFKPNPPYRYCIARLGTALE